MPPEINSMPMTSPLAKMRPDLQKAQEEYEKSKVGDVLTDDKTKSMVLGNFEDWIKILVATIKYQDPTDPMDPSEMAAQFASFGQVMGLMEVNDQLKKSSDMQANTQLLEAASQMDRIVEFKGDKFHFSKDQASEISFTAPPGSKYSSLIITDDQKRIIDIKTLETTPEKKTSFKWDGILKDGKIAERGTYTVKVAPLNEDKKIMRNVVTGKDYQIATVIKGIVSGGMRDQSKPKLVMGGEGGVSYPLESMIAIHSNQQPVVKKENVSTETSPAPSIPPEQKVDDVVAN